MSSCFLCDCSYKFLERDKHLFAASYDDDENFPLRKLMKQLPIIVGSSGTELDDQQHDNSKKQNYVSYRVKKIEFQCSISNTADREEPVLNFPDYILIFKVPFRDPVFDYEFFFLSNFMLYSEPESVLGYTIRYFNDSRTTKGLPKNVKIDINKPFVVGPNDYVGVFYMLSVPVGSSVSQRKVEASAKVWFDIA